MFGLIRIKQKLQKSFLKKECLETFVEGVYTFQIVDYKWKLNIFRPKRSIDFIPHNAFKNIFDHCFYSAIYINKKYINQPYIPCIEKAYDAWNKIHKAKRALVLGCAGCSFPRHFNLAYPDCHTIGIEYSEKLIEIARKYFLDGLDMNRFDLIHGDAFEYVPNYKGEPFDIIFVDLFEGDDALMKKIMEGSFLLRIKDILSLNGIVVFNINNGANSLRKKLLPLFPWVGYFKTPQGSNPVCAINCQNIKDVVEWKRELLENKWIWV